jgi:uncharacterized protein YjbI with pentapeptide repeats
MGRDFSGQNLRGRNFRGQDLRGANFSSADIRGANFTDAELQGADFTGAIAGLQKRWAIGQAILVFSLSLFFNFTYAFLNSIFTIYFSLESVVKEISIVPIFVLSLLIFGLILTIPKHGFTTRALLIFISSFGFAFLFMLPFARELIGAVAVAAAVTGVSAVAVVGIAAVAVALVRTSAVAVAFQGAIIGAGAGAGGAAGGSTSIFVDASTAMIMVKIAVAVAIPIATLTWLIGIYAALRANQGDEKFMIIRAFSLMFGALGGTSFSGANLTDANFTHTILKNTNFANSRKQTTTLTRTHLQNSKQLHEARPGTAIFSNFKVLQLITTGQGNNQDFSNLNLRGANLDSAHLNGATLKNTDLTEASLQSTDLQHANLTELQAISANFTGAYLTGACLEAWNIQSANLSDIDCAFYFLRETPDAKGSRDRRPHDPDRTYELGDAEKMLTEARNIVEVLLKQCTNAKDLAQSLQRLTETYPESILQKLERKDNSDFLVTLTVPPDTDKANVETLLHTAYDEIRALRGEVKDLHTLRAVDLKDALLAIAHHPKPFIQTIQQTTGDYTVTTQENQAISAGSGSFINTGNLNATNSTLGIISGNATTSIGQLPTSSSNEPDLKTALTDLQTAIESSSLSDDDKAEALEQVKSIADAGNNPQNNAIQKGVKTAMKMLKGTIADLPATEDLVKVMIKIAPIVAAFFGMPAM